MRFIVDECTGPKVAKWLLNLNHHVFSVYDENPGISDKKILQKATLDNYIIITNDKDFGELIFLHKLPHKGVILLRLENENSNNKINVLKKILKLYINELENKFIVASENSIRIAKKSWCFNY